MNTLKKENNSEAFIKIIRLISNLIVVEEIGIDIFRNYTEIYINILNILILMLISKDVEIHEEIISCCLQCLSNITYYHRPNLSNIKY